MAGLSRVTANLTGEEHDLGTPDRRPRIAIVISDGGFWGEAALEILEQTSLMKGSDYDPPIKIITIGMNLAGWEKDIMVNMASLLGDQEMPAYFDASDPISLHRALVNGTKEFCGPVLLKTRIDETVTTQGGSTTGSWQIKRNPVWEYGSATVNVSGNATAMHNGAPVTWGTMQSSDFNRLIRVEEDSMYDASTNVMIAPSDKGFERKFVLSVSEDHLSDSMGESLAHVFVTRRVENDDDVEWTTVNSSTLVATSYPLEIEPEIDWFADWHGGSATGVHWDTEHQMLHVRLKVHTDNEFASNQDVPITISSFAAEGRNDPAAGGFVYLSGSDDPKWRLEWPIYSGIRAPAGEDEHFIEARFTYLGDNPEVLHYLEIALTGAGKTVYAHKHFRITDGVFTPLPFS